VTQHTIKVAKYMWWTDGVHSVCWNVRNTETASARPRGSFTAAKLCFRRTRRWA
jgi:hypothetical protein